MAKWTEAEVVSTKQETERVRRIWLRPDTEERMSFIPGQYITFDLPVGEKRLQRWKSYSIADITDEGLIEICVGIVPDGPASTYLCQTIDLGHKLTFKGPEGGFTLPEILPERVVMICTGTGIVPFIAMLKDELLVKSNRETTFHLIFGTRFETDILYKEELILFKQCPNFKTDIALSKYSGNGLYHKGYVHSVYMSHYNNDDEKPLFYICGWQSMVDDAVLNLFNNMQVERSKIRVELYG